MALKKRGWTKCGVTGCRKHQIKGSIYCAEHREFHRPRLVPGTLPGTKGVLTALCAAVSAKYKEQGDETRAGVVVACLSHDPPRYYASVARYPDGPFGKKQIVAKTRVSDAYETAEDAVSALAEVWYSQVRPPPVRETLENLSEVIQQRKLSEPP